MATGIFLRPAPIAISNPLNQLARLRPSFVLSLIRLASDTLERTIIGLSIHDPASLAITLEPGASDRMLKLASAIDRADPMSLACVFLPSQMPQKAAATP
jgi:hypothetical protein